MIINKIKDWLKKEIKSYKDIQKRIDGGEHWENVCDEPQIFYGRNECAEGLLNQIKKWESKKKTMIDFTLLKAVVSQIKIDAEKEDYTAIEELFLNIPSKDLKNFLGDKNGND